MTCDRAIGGPAKLNTKHMFNIHLKENPTLEDFQTYAQEMVNERGFDKETIPEIFMLFLEECGELSKAARKTQNIKTDKKSEIFRLEQEAADVFIYLLQICNRFDINLEKAFRNKEEINKKRNWE
ncbi:MAG: RS21-C6 protein [bacterium]